VLGGGGARAPAPLNQWQWNTKEEREDSMMQKRIEGDMELNDQLYFHVMNRGQYLINHYHYLSELFSQKHLSILYAFGVIV
jgi:hypothetical protein